jgi:hypothetical protein
MSIEFIVASVIVCLAGFVQATTGIGFAMIAVPLLALVDLEYAPGPILFAMLFLAIAMAFGSWSDVDTKGFPYLFSGLVLGTVTGSVVVGILTDTALGVTFGAIVLVGIGIGAMGYAPHRSPGVNIIGGTVSGAMGTISGIHGPPLAVLYQNASPRVARATIAFVFVLASGLSLMALSVAGLFGMSELRLGVSLIPGVALGFVIASRWRRFISDSVAKTGMLSIAAISSVVLIARSLA